MTKLSEVLPGQIWEAKDGDKREVLAVGLNTLVTRFTYPSGKSNKPFVWGEGGDPLDKGLRFLHRLVRPRQTKYIRIIQHDGSPRFDPSLRLFDTLKEAQNYGLVRDVKIVAIVPVEFAEGDNLPQ